MSERTLAIIKPDAVKKKVTGKIIQRIEDEGFRISRMEMIRPTRGLAEGFYAVHKSKPFYSSLTEFMSSGEIVVLLLERDGAIAHWRSVMGATDPAVAAPGTIRRAFGFSIERNAVHGSDGPDTAAWEIDYFFKNK
ncbi:MAG: nucleoside-diphosphate kinase [Candidatus Aminicenantes bacterium]|nr:nucleoside-diphosphate kinase [Candidatus Aminicenantes bacterium]